MSKTIDMGNQDSWTDDDIIYLRDRGRLPEGYKLASHLREEPAAPPLDETPYIGDEGTAPDSLSGPMDGSTGVFVDDEDFNDMPKSRLQAEARARGLDDSGNKGDLVNRLQAYEASQGQE